MFGETRHAASLVNSRIAVAFFAINAKSSIASPSSTFFECSSFCLIYFWRGLRSCTRPASGQVESVRPGPVVGVLHLEHQPASYSTLAATAVRSLRPETALLPPVGFGYDHGPG